MSDSNRNTLPVMDLQQRHDQSQVTNDEVSLTTSMVMSHHHSVSRPAHVAQWSTHSGAMSTGAWCASGARFKAQSMGASAFHQRIVSNNFHAHDEHRHNPGCKRRVQWCLL